MSGSEDLEQELRLVKAACAEWLEKYERAEKRMGTLWDLVLDEARTRIRPHAPRCLNECALCWAHEELGKMRRGDANNYVPIKERLKKAAEDLESRCKMDPARREAYVDGLADMLAAANPMLGNTE